MDLRRYLLIVLLSFIGFFLIGMIGSTRLKMAVTQTNNPALFVGSWVYTDQFDRTVTWLVSRDGKLKFFASDDPTDIQEYQWWTSHDKMIIRPVISNSDHAYHTVSFALNGRTFDDQRVELPISHSDTKSLTLIPDDGPTLELTKLDSAR